MRKSAVVLLVGLALACSSCETATPTKVAVPPTPQPEKRAPVVVAQTVAHLPEPQPIPPEAIPPRPPVEYHPRAKEVEKPADAEPLHDVKAVKPVAKPRRRTPTTETAEGLPATALPEEPVVTPGSARLSTADESSLSKAQVNKTLMEVQQILKSITTRPETAASQAALTRIRSFVRLSEQALAKNDLRQGNALAHRALALTRDLAVEK
jgi:hypothetical protein